MLTFRNTLNRLEAQMNGYRKRLVYLETHHKGTSQSEIAILKAKMETLSGAMVEITQLHADLVRRIPLTEVL